MIQLFKKVTVEQIHAEFDSAQDRLQKQAEDILNTLSIPTESAIERKAKLAQELGFVNSEVVNKAKGIFERNSKIQKTLEMTRLQADTLNELKFKYTNEKFLTVEELDRICAKYNLIHCPIANYIKDIPEKNLMEIKNVKGLIPQDAEKSFYKITKFSFWDGATRAYKNWVKENILNKEYDSDILLSEIGFVVLTKEFKGNRGSSYYFNKIEATKIDKSGLFIAAPPSHFDTKGLSKKGTFGWFNVQTIEVKDPVVFEYCKNGFIRVITKWGTEDDQSYLDQSLINEKLN